MLDIFLIKYKHDIFMNIKHLTWWQDEDFFTFKYSITLNT